MEGVVSGAASEDFRKEVADIKDTTTRRFYILAKLNNLAHFRAAEFKTLIAAADVSGNYGVAALLETCLADKLALAERTQQWLRRIAEIDIAEKIGAKRADRPEPSEIRHQAVPKQVRRVRVRSLHPARRRSIRGPIDNQTVDASGTEQLDGRGALQPVPV